MDTTAHDNPRPVTVKLALILLALDSGVAFVMDVVNFQLGHYIMFGSWLFEGLLFFVLLWCAFRGKNWARWFVAVWTVLLEVCISPVVWVRYHQTFSTLGAVWFWFGWLLDIIAVLALFHTSSNLWFRGPKMPLNHSPEPTAGSAFNSASRSMSPGGGGSVQGR
jgi:FtsH-binding integral membrane protein